MNTKIVETAKAAMEAWRQAEAGTGNILVPYDVYQAFIELEVAIEAQPANEGDQHA
jgi:hypothetical protein